MSNQQEQLVNPPQVQTQMTNPPHPKASAETDKQKSEKVKDGRGVRMRASHSLRLIDGTLIHPGTVFTCSEDEAKGFEHVFKGQDSPAIGVWHDPQETSFTRAQRL